MVLITTYDELNAYVDFFSTFNANLMIIDGPPGVGKSETIKRALQGKNVQHHYQEGYITKTSFMKTLYDHRDDPIVIDDTDNLFADKAVFGILREAFDTRDERTVSYASTSPLMADLPQHFSITSPLMIITNGLKSSTVMDAFKNRAVYIDFRPTHDEICKKLYSITRSKNSIKHDTLVFDRFKKYSALAKQPNLRSYILSVKLKDAGIDWKKHMRDSMQIDPLIGAMIEATESSTSFKKRGERFRELTGKSERTYSRYLKKYGGRI